MTRDVGSFSSHLNLLLGASKNNVKMALELCKYKRYVFFHARTHRANAFSSIACKLSDADYWRILADVWIDTENADECWNVWTQLVGKKTSRRPGIEYMMLQDEQQALKDLPEIITVYRGHVGRPSRFRDFSWTTDVSVARWFANRFSADGHVLVGTVQKSDVLALFLRRNDNQIMVYPNDVTIVGEASSH